jgi:hypothetical protein
LVSGLVGGIASSTAVAVATGRIAQKSPEKSTAALQARCWKLHHVPAHPRAVWIVSPAYGAALSGSFHSSSRSA